MAPFFSFAVLQLAPDDGRGESINIGAVIFRDDRVDVRWSKRLEKVRVLSQAVDANAIRDIVEGMTGIDERLVANGVVEAKNRHSQLARLGPLALSELGSFSASSSNEYEERVATIMRSMVEPEPAPRRVRLKRSRLLTQLKADLRQEKVLAKPDEDLNSHRVVAGFELDEGLVADLVLKNGALHVIETVDASSEDEAPRRAIGDVALAALVLERARMRFGPDVTKSKLVYVASAQTEKLTLPALEAAHNQGAELVNWASIADRSKLVHSLASLATPRVSSRRRKGQVFVGHPQLKLS